MCKMFVIFNAAEIWLQSTILKKSRLDFIQPTDPDYLITVVILN
jgi:hypothetical protein